MVDKIYQAVNRFYEGGEAPAVTAEDAETTNETGEETGEATTEPATEPAEPQAETQAQTENTSEATEEESTAENHSAAAESTENKTPQGQQEEKSS